MLTVTHAEYDDVCHPLFQCLILWNQLDCPTFEKLFCGKKVQRRVQKMGVGRKMVYEINPNILARNASHNIAKNK